ncbi:lectin like domain-containing protein [Ethanoligenens sp.]|uniref:lectin like domain-containing protein n=1 Tax=Ethanoligenens sp. TaxID=2099655 RepID=UPI0039EBA8C5
MKKRWMKWSAILSAVGFLLVFAIGEEPLQAAAAALSTVGSSAAVLHLQSAQIGKQSNGYVTPGYKVPHAGASTVKRYQSSNIPSSYDLRSQNKVTSVKDQDNNNDCWAFAAMGSLESTLMPSENDNFSESDLQNTSGFDFGPNDGGNDQMATAYLARWSGPSMSSGVQKHVQNVDWLPNRTGYGDTTVDNAIKQAVINGTAVAVPLYFDDNYYNSGTYSYYYNGGNSSNHEIDVVGWDDNYPASNFSGKSGGTPAYNGAFLCKNSWGTGWGDKGYFYISYCDTVFGEDGSTVYDDAESTGNYSEIYQYDPLGFTAATEGSSGIQWMANVFKANDNNSLTAVSFYTLAPSAGYKVYVIPQYTGSLSSNTRKLVASGTESEAGYHTAELSSSIALKQGSTFAVEVQFTAQGVQIPLEAPVKGYSSKATASAGQSFVSYDGNGWTDTTQAFGSNLNANVCVKAFTTAPDSPDSTDNSSSSQPSGSSSSDSAGTVKTPPVLSPQMNLESPDSSTQYGNVTVAGWALNSAGVSRVDVYIDKGTANQKLYSTLVNLPRADVKTIVDPDGHYIGSSNSGFNLSIPAADFAAGQHTVSAEAIGSDGTVQWTVRSFTAGPASASSLDSPATAMCSGNVTISGWALNHAGMNRVDVYIDLGTASQKFFSTLVNGNRADVKTIVDPDGHYIGSSNSGFNLMIPAAALPAGQHTLNAAAIGNDGTVQWMVRSFTVGPTSVSSLDSPAAATCSGDVKVSGWALNHAGMNRVDVYVDLGTASQKFFSTLVNGSRADVKTIVDPDGQYIGSSNSGFNLMIPAAALPAGQHTLNAAAIGNDGTVQWMVRSFTVGPDSVCSLDSPAAAMCSGNVEVSGWALNHAGMNRVDVYVDLGTTSQKFFSTSVNGSRADVKTIVDPDGQYIGSSNSGFSLTIPVAALSAGQHTLNVAAIGNDGTVQWMVRSFGV